MSLQELARRIRSELPALVLLNNEPMSGHTSFQIGGPAELFAMPGSVDELISVLNICKDVNINPVILGSGSNVLAPDAGINNLVIKTRGIDEIRLIDENTIQAECGCALSRLAVTAARNNLTGLEFAHGIPGSVGGAVLMNAGAYGGEIKDVCIETDYLSGGEIATISGEDHNFSYRNSLFSENGFIILRSRFRLSPKAEVKILKTMEELSKKRRAAQPLDFPSAGSAFRRPEGGYAATLIDGAGLKGFRIGGAMVSEKHAGFIINAGGATSADVIALIGHIKETVLNKSGIELTPEIRVLS